MVKVKTVLVMSYSDNSGTPSVCPYLLSSHEVAIAKWIIEHASETETQFIAVDVHEQEKGDV